MPELDIDALVNKYGGGKETPAVPIADIEALVKKYGGGAKAEFTPEGGIKVAASPLETPKEFGESILQGLKDVPNTGAALIGSIDSAIDLNGVSGGQQRNADFRKRLDEENKSFKSTPANELGRTVGQVIATAPLLPAKIPSMIDAGLGAVPTVLKTGEKLAAPFLNRLGASVGTGAAAGGIFGAATNESNDKSLGENVSENMLGGAVGGPVVLGAGSAAGKTIDIIKSLWANNKISGKILADSGISGAAAKNVVQRLAEAGYTPDMAAQELKRLGPTATLADLDASLTTEASGLAALGGKPTSLLKNTFKDRADTADSEAHNIMLKNWGAKPDLEAEKEAIEQAAHKAVDADYKIARESNQKLDLKPLVAEINKNMEKAVGSEQSVLKTAKSYLYKQVKGKDADGNDVISPVLKDDVESLHKIRKGLDFDLAQLKKEGTSQAGDTYRSLLDVRSKVDALLKTNDAMKAADEKFAAHMTIANGLDFGKEMLRKGSYEENEKIYNRANAETKEMIKKGLRVDVGDLMEKATRGELSEARRLFDKSSKNQKLIKLVFGDKGEEVIDALKKEGMFRATENAVRGGSQTAERNAVSERYGGPAEAKNDGIVKSSILPLAGDVVLGGGGALSLANAARVVGTGVKRNFLQVRHGNMVEGTADLISRQGVQRDNALTMLGAVERVQSRIGAQGPFKNRLPTAEASIGDYAIDRTKKLTGR